MPRTAEHVLRLAKPRHLQEPSRAGPAEYRGLRKLAATVRGNYRSSWGRHANVQQRMPNDLATVSLNQGERGIRLPIRIGRCDFLSTWAGKPQFGTERRLNAVDLYEKLSSLHRRSPEQGPFRHRRATQRAPDRSHVAIRSQPSIRPASPNRQTASPPAELPDRSAAHAVVETKRKTPWQRLV